MKRITLGALAGLLLLSAATFAGPAVEVDPNSIVFLEGVRELGGQYYDTFEFNVVLTDASGLPETGDPLVDNVTGIGIGSALSGPGASHLIPVAVFNQRTASDWAQIISPAVYMPDDYNATSNSRDAEGLLTTAMVDERPVYDEYFNPVGLQGVPAEEGTVVARFIYWWDGEGVDPNDVSISLADDASPLTPPYLLTNDGKFPCGGLLDGFGGTALLFEGEGLLLDGGEPVSGISLGWGENQGGQLANSALGYWFFPVPADGPGDELVMSDVVMSDGGDKHTLALRVDGTVWAWGMNENGEVGQEIGVVVKTFRPMQVRGPGGVGVLTDVKAVAAGCLCSMALKNDGTVWVWGTNGSYGLGDGGPTQSSFPIQVKGRGGEGDLTEIAQIGTGDRFMVALKDDGTVWAWGENWYGQLGTEPNEGGTYWPEPVLAPDGSQFEYLTDIQAISVGQHHTLALNEDESVWAWGHNFGGQLGNGTTTNRSRPVAVKNVAGETPGYLENIEKIATGYNHSFALQRNPATDRLEAVAWGHNNYGMLGNTSNDSTEPPSDSALPVRVWGLDGEGTVLSNVVSIAGGVSHSLAVLGADPAEGIAEGTVVGWGWNFMGQAGLGEPVGRRLNPARVLGLEGVAENELTGVSAVRCGGYHSLAVAEQLKWDWDWVYQNTETTTADKHVSVLTIMIPGNDDPNDTYELDIQEDGGDLTNFTMGTPQVVGNTLVVDFIGGRAGTTAANAPGSAALAVTVTMTHPLIPQGTRVTSGTETTNLQLRKLGDLDGSGGAPVALDKQNFNKRLNGIATGLPDRAFDLNASGGEPNAVDKQIMNQLLNGVAIP